MDDLKLIKKHYGENMMHLCRELFPTLLETPGLLFETLSKTFAYSRLLYNDIKNGIINEDNFKDLIFNKSRTTEAKENKATKAPQKLLEEAGYTLYECHSEKDIQSFRHFYKRRDGKALPEYVEGTKPPYYNGEELCTFNGNRLDRCHVFFAVKKNADKLKREDFNDPKRQDEYGTSVISIQFSKGSRNTLSIKNRYNHTVDNPDATFSNNLDNIIEGLTEAFEETYGLNINASSTKEDFPGYVLANDGKYYKYNYEINNIYYCPDNIIIENFEVIHYDKSRYLVFETFIIDLQGKLILKFDDDNPDSFIDTMPPIPIKSIKIENIENQRKRIIINDNIEIIIDKTNKIKSYKNSDVKIIKDAFLRRCQSIEEIDLPNVEEIGHDFLYYTSFLKRLNLPNCRKIGNCFLCYDTDLTSIDLPNVEIIGDSFMEHNDSLSKINIPKCKIIGNNLLKINNSLERINLPLVTQIGHSFLAYNNKIKEIDLPLVEKIGYRFLINNNSLKKINLPKCKDIGSSFLMFNNSLEEINLPSVEVIGNNFLKSNIYLKKLIAPNVEEIDDYFLFSNSELEYINLPKLKSLGSNALIENTNLAIINAPNLTFIPGYKRKGWNNNSIIEKVVEENLAKKQSEQDDDYGTK